MKVNYTGQSRGRVHQARAVLLLGSLLLSAAPLAQAIDCSAWCTLKDGCPSDAKSIGSFNNAIGPELNPHDGGFRSTAGSQDTIVEMCHDGNTIQNWQAQTEWCGVTVRWTTADWKGYTSVFSPPDAVGGCCTMPVPICSNLISQAYLYK